MRALVVYESMFGNTEAIARAVADGLCAARDLTPDDVRLADVTTMPSAEGVDLLVVGAPTHAFGLSRPSTRKDAQQRGPIRPGAAEVGLREYLNVSPSLTGLAAAAFDTKVDKPRLPGSAARRARRELRRLGCRVLVPPESFRVHGTAGPLLDGEVERARRWGAALAAALPAERRRV
ncbi:MAG TPA: flavodoxin domain-containing protein [Actinoplanes sp.]|nr:flavodoxin domain-containing protein [Actinoplanes sp.]